MTHPHNPKYPPQKNLPKKPKAPPPSWISNYCASMAWHCLGFFMVQTCKPNPPYPNLIQDAQSFSNSFEWGTWGCEKIWVR
jgi:hypothetical protein